MALTIAEALAAYRDHLVAAGLQEKPLSDMFTLLKGVIDDHEPVTALTAERLERNLARRRRIGQSPETIFTLYHFCRRLGTYLVERGHLQANPTDTLKPPGKGKRSRRPATGEEITALLQAATLTRWPARDYCIVVLLARTGIRRKELTKLNLGDVNLSERWLYIAHSKNGRDRYVRFDQLTADALTLYLDTRQHLPAEALFLNFFGKQRMSVGSVSMLFRRLCDLAGVNVSAHQLRHAFATGWINIGRAGDIALMHQLGHSDLRMTQHYARLAREGLGRAYDQTYGQEPPPPPKPDPRPREILGEVKGAMPGPEELKEAVTQHPNVSGLARIYDVPDHVLRAWLRHYGLYEHYSRCRRENRQTALGQITAKELAGLILETPNWAELGRQLGLAESSVRRWAERSDLLSLYHLAKERKTK